MRTAEASELGRTQRYYPAPHPITPHLILTQSPLTSSSLQRYLPLDPRALGEGLYVASDRDRLGSQLVHCGGLSSLLLSFSFYFIVF